jgi:4-amino-4-deoxy-L-arabinose transferase-like glycosyltransferase
VTWLRAHRPSPAVIEGAAMGLILLIALVHRITELVQVAGQPLAPDAIGYRKIAIHMPLTAPYHTWVREPGWIWLARIWFEIFGHAAVQLRILSMVFGMATIVAAWWFARRYFSSRVVGVLTAALLATNAELIFQSTRGLRLEAMSFFLVVFVYFTFVDEVPRRRRIAGLTAGGAMAILVNFSAFTAVVPLVVYAAWRHRLGIRGAALVLGVIIVLVLPNLRYEQETTGDPFWASDIAATWYRNFEFVGIRHIACDGCPTPSEYAVDSFSGSPTTWTHYILGMHPFGTVVRRFGAGYRTVFLERSDLNRWIMGPRSRPHAETILFLAVWIGAIGMLFSRRRVFLVVPPLLLVGTAFLIPPPLHVDRRLVEHLSPFMAMVAASAWLVVLAGARVARPYVERLRPASPAEGRRPRSGAPASPDVQHGPAQE